MTYQEWRHALETLIDQGLREHQPARVAAALGAEVARVGALPSRPVVPGPPSPVTRSPDFEVTSPVLGVDACQSGWVGVCLRPGEKPVVLVGRSIAALVELARTSGPVSLVAIDIPIGLPDTGGRQADVLARRELPGKASSVFSTLTRPAYEAETYAEGREAQVVATGGTSASAQAYALRAKILEVDAWVRGRAGIEVIEVHPEVSFARMAGEPLLARKKDTDGVALRRTVLDRKSVV